ncbi:MAG: hypothetical protein K2F73_02330 [Ruminococcus sp.]|nr:hypothetical protein [Ruminococcus sp.]MDE6101802.1 hypothetical protein [Ruminococcus sp.]
MNISEFSNPTSERIYILIELLNEIETYSNKDNAIISSDSQSDNLTIIESFLYDAIEAVAEKTGSTPHHVERVLNDIITDGDMRLNIVYFCYDIIEWLITGDRTKIRKVLIYNISDNFPDGDKKAIDNWYSNIV